MGKEPNIIMHRFVCAGVKSQGGSWGWGWGEAVGRVELGMR